MQDSDRDYVTRTILMSFQAGSKEVRKINQDSYLQAHNKTINKILDRSKCLIVCDEEDEGLIYSFLIFEHGGNFDFLHYIYTRKNFRNNGFVKAQLTALGKNKTLVITHLVDNFQPARLKEYWDKVIYDPYARA